MPPKFIKVRGQLYRLAQAPDEAAVNELQLYIDNTKQLYDQKMRMYGRLALFVAKKTYNPELAVKLFKYLSDEAARSYVREFGPVQFDVATRKSLATQLRDAFEADLRSSPEYFKAMLPKKYQGFPLAL